MYKLLLSFFPTNLLLLPLLFLPLSMHAQSMDKATQPNEEEKTPSHTSAPQQLNKSIQALWDLQFAYDLSESMQFSISNGIYTDTEFWVSEWNSDTLARFDHDGNFIDLVIIPGLSDVRGMTWDGNSIWMANNSTTIYQINPATQQISNTIQLNINGENARFLSWDPTADNGNGGFWTGNFNTDIFLVDMSGEIISTIPQNTHTLGGMYGLAVDHQSPEGPYLWVFHQAGAPNDALISQLHLPEGTPTGVGRNVEYDLNTYGALAGGLFITNNWSSDGSPTLAGVLQDNPDILFGYELSYVPGDPINVGAQEIVTPLSACTLGNQETVEVVLVNDGPLPTANIQLSLYLNDMLIAEETYPGTLMPGQTDTYVFDASLDLSTPGSYTLTVFATTDDDINNLNDRAQKNVASKTYIYPPLSNNFDEYEEEITQFPELYNIGRIAFQTNAGSTPSSNTGPSQDLSADGNYIYMEASGYNEGDQAILTTDCLDFTTVEDPQLVFYYHMYGNGIGYLSVDLTDEAGQTTNLFLQEGQAQTSSEDDWIPELIDLSAWSGQIVEISFTGEIGTEGQTFRCDIALDEIQIIGCPVIDANADIIPPSGNNEGSITLNPTGGTAPFTYLWNTGETDAQITFLQGGDFTVTITDDKGCATTVTFSAVNVHELNGLKRFEVSPNPASGPFNLTLEGNLNGPIRIDLLDATGLPIHLLYEGVFQGFLQKEINTPQLPAGIYLLRLSANEGTVLRRIAIQ